MKKEIGDTGITPSISIEKLIELKKNNKVREEKLNRINIDKIGYWNENHFQDVRNHLKKYTSLILKMKI